LRAIATRHKPSFMEIVICSAEITKTSILGPTQ